MLCLSDDGEFAASLDSSLSSLDGATTVRHVRTPAAARAELVSASAAISCIVLAAPTAAGDEGAFVRDIYAQGIDVPVVVAAADQETATRAVEAGATDYVVRDDDPETMSWLAFRVERALGECTLARSHRDRIEQQRVVSEIGTRALTAVDLDSTLDHAASRVRDVLDASSVTIFEGLDDGAFRVAAAAGWSANRDHGLAAAGGTQAVETYRSGRSTLVDDFDDDERFEHASDAGPSGPKSGMSAAIGGDDTRWGVIAVHGVASGQFSDDDVLFLENIAAVVGAATERHELKSALSEVLERMDEAVMGFDADWRVTYVNSTAEHGLGMSAEAVLGTRIWDSVPESAVFREEFERAMERQEPATFEQYYDRLETWYAVRAYPSETGLSVYFTDITEQLEHEVEAEQYGRMLAAVADAVYALDDEGRFAAVNPAFERLTGLDRDRVIGSSTALLTENASATDGSDEAFASTSQGIVELDLRTPDEGVVRVEDHRTPLVVGGEEVGSVGVLRDVTKRHRYERLLATLHDRTREMMGATDRQAVLRAAVDACDEVLGDARTELFVFDEADTSLVRVGAAGTGLGDKPVGGGLDRGGVWDAFVSGEVRVVELAPDGGVVDGVERVIAAPLGRHGVLVTGHPGTVAPDEVDVELVNLLSATVEELLDRIDAEAELRERDRRLEAQNEALTRLDRINATIRNINQSLIRAPTRGEALSAVAKHLVDADDYAIVWHAEARDVDETYRPTSDAVHGADTAYADRLGEVASAEPLFPLLEAAVETREIQVVADVLDDPAWADHRGDALSYGFRAIAVIPAVADDRVEALFVVHATDPDAFADDDGLLTDLGETVGYALAATGRADAMLTERRTDVQVQLGGDRLSLSRLARRVGRAVSLGGVIPNSDGSVIAFVTSDAEPEEVVAAGRDIATRVRHVSTDDSGSLFELRLPRESLFETLYASEATLRALDATPTQTTLTAEVPERIRVRSFVDALDSNYPGTSLLSRRTADDGTESPQTFAAEMREAWTSRQYESIRAAHLSGFYEWPRRSTAETLAETFDISAPTYQYHLRAAERKLVGRVFE
ncbi:light and oxygen sensing histidine kinase [Haloferax gibbonsii ATCC 33959]|uniref:Light and oxygen sensing histidine kinase n=1 Tax=Haloferax gibbonsii (strain ATCC 33959 / DSM 4427 / JCM 8863 / NBRC 102184 / NCIMB 2188 / Ma 2.38) TaxID=1227459 RepID=M0H635_HALGM|nr:light and oxygen sensing histidine kinase [Haloferax gibbonsii ATCC 33959]